MAFVNGRLSVSEQLDTAVAEVLSNEGWCEAEMLIPGDLPPGDAPALLSMTATVKGSGGGGGGGKKEKGGGGGGGEDVEVGSGGGVGEVKLVCDLALATSAFLEAAGRADHA